MEGNLQTRVKMQVVDREKTVGRSNCVCLKTAQLIGSHFTAFRLQTGSVSLVSVHIHIVICCSCLTMSLMLTSVVTIWFLFY